MSLRVLGTVDQYSVVSFGEQIGGVRAPSPVGELGNVEMTQAISLVDTRWQAVGPDMLLTGAQL